MRDINAEAKQYLYDETRRRNWHTRRASKGRKYKTAVNFAVEDYVVLDFETTGFRAGADRIIQIGAIKYVNHEMKDILSSNINPLRHIPLSVTQRTGISNEMVKAAPTIHEKIDELLSFIGDFPIVAHRASFDMGFLYALERMEAVDIPEYTVIDTAKLARRAIMEAPNHKLSSLTNYLKIEHETHDAIGDCLATAAIYQYCTKNHFYLKY